MKKNFKNGIALVASLAMVLTSLPATTVFAGDEGEKEGWADNHAAYIYENSDGELVHAYLQTTGTGMCDDQYVVTAYEDAKCTVKVDNDDNPYTFPAEATLASHYPTTKTEVTTAATCLTEGEGLTWQECEKCGAQLTEKTEYTIAALGHLENTTGKIVKTVEPTCTEDGYNKIVYTCQRCGKQISSENEILPAAHTYGDPVIVKEATCTEDGEAEYTCTVCGYKTTETIEALGHDISETQVEGTYVAPTCTEDGYYMAVKSCTRCDENFGEEKVIVANLGGHVWGETKVITESTCSEAGEGEHTCTVCGTTEKVELPLADHTYDSTVSPVRDNTFVAATCTHGGSYYSADKCKVCGQLYNYEKHLTDMIEHTYEFEYVYSKPFTCTEDGVADVTITCAFCDFEETLEDVTILAHHVKGEETQNVNVVEATCTEAGQYVILPVCENCGKAFNDGTAPIITIDALGHDPVRTVTKEVTCTEDGTVEYTCSRCNAVLDPEDEDENIFVLAVATCTNATAEHKTCGSTNVYLDEEGNYVCEDCTAAAQAEADAAAKEADPESEGADPVDPVTFDPEVLEAVGHNYVQSGIEYPEECTEPGAVVSKCSNCGDITREEIPASGHDLVITGHTEDSIIYGCDNVNYTKPCDYTETVEATTDEEKEILEGLHEWITEAQKAGKVTDGDPVQEWVENDPVVCQKITYTCKICGAKETVEVKHEFEYGGVITEPTCTTPGDALRACKYAADCQCKNAYVVGDEDLIGTSPAWDKEQKVQYTAYDESLEATGHDYTLTDVTVHFSDDNDGTGWFEFKYNCANCNAAVEKEVPFDEYGVEAVRDTIKEATCTEEGFTALELDVDFYKYWNSKDEDSDIPIMLDDDDYAEIEALEEAGEEVPEIVNAYGYSEASKETIAKVDHRPALPVRENVVEATCTSEGSYDSVKYCKNCGTEMSRETVVTEKLAHVPAEAVAVYSEGYGESDILDWVITWTIKCENCGEVLDTDEEVIREVPGHHPSDPVVDEESYIAPTCLVGGYEELVVYCNDCEDVELGRIVLVGEEDLADEENDIFYSEALAATGHHSDASSIKEENYVAPTCTEPGYVEIAEYCAACGIELSRVAYVGDMELVDPDEDIYFDGALEPVGHKFGYTEKVYTVVPTCTEAGAYAMVTYCGICFEEISRSEETAVDPIGHVAVIDPAVPATETSTGLTEGSHCSVCGYIIKAQEIIPAVDPEPVTFNFKDVKAGSYYEDAVYALANAGIMTGYNDTVFGVGAAITRQEFATILYRALGDDADYGLADYTDADEIAKYAVKAVAWAQEMGYITGYADGSFGPTDTVTRQQVATILYRIEGSPAVSTSLDDYTDADAVAGYALNGVKWAVENGIFGRGTTTLNPAGGCTREQVATIFARYLGMVD